jgi:ABC-type polar amino acid transport system ATPase subunit
MEHNIDNKPVMIEMNQVNKWYDDYHALDNINLKVRKGERMVICGPSGSGKSTLIRTINRLEEHQYGQIIVEGVEMTPDVKKIHEIRKEVGMVFMDAGKIVEKSTPKEFFSNPKEERTRQFLNQILNN